VGVERSALSASGEHGQEPPVAPARVGMRSAALSIILVLLLVAALHFAESVLVPIAFGVLISYALDPIVTSLERLKVPRGLGATLVLTLLVAGGCGLAYSLRYQAAALATQLPTAAERVRASLRDLRSSRGADSPVQKVQQAAKTLERAATEASSAPASSGEAPEVQVQPSPVSVGDVVVAGTMRVGELAAEAVVVFFLALYLLAAGDLFKRKLVKLAGPSLSEKKVTLQILQDIDRQVAAFLLIRVIISAVVAAATWLVLLPVGVNQAGVWGIAAGVCNLVPYAGPAFITAALSIVAFVQFGSWSMALLVAFLVTAVATAEGYWLTPWLTGRAARMNNVAVFVGLLFWGWVWGIAGLLLAVPLLMVTKAVCDRIEGLQPIGELLGE
jgi:predicted PurR-regulated permease PerM